MNIVITSLLTVSLLVVAPSCTQKDKYSTKSVSYANQVEQDECAYALEDEIVTSPNIKC